MALLKDSPSLRRVAGLAAIALMLVIVALSLMPQADLPPVEGSDKLKHFIAYAALSVPVTIWAGPGRSLRALLLTAGFGALVEVAQLLAPTGREFSLLDGGANLIGAGLGTLVAVVLRR